MAGAQILVERMTDHDYSSISQATTATSGVTVLAEVDVAPWREGTLEVLLDTADIMPNATLEVFVQSMARTDDDPGVTYTKATSVAEIVLDDGSTPAALIRAAFSASFGSMVRVCLKASVSGEAIGNIEARFETRLTMKNGA